MTDPSPPQAPDVGNSPTDEVGKTPMPTIFTMILQGLQGVKGKDIEDIVPGDFPAPVQEVALVVKYLLEIEKSFARLMIESARRDENTHELRSGLHSLLHEIVLTFPRSEIVLDQAVRPTPDSQS